MAVITFCSNEIKETGQTLSMAAIASYMAIEHNYKILMISTGFNDLTLENCFWEYNKIRSTRWVQKQDVRSNGLITGDKGLINEIKTKSFDRLSYADKKNIKLITDKETSLDIKDMIHDPIIKNIDDNEKISEKVLKKYILKELEHFFLELGTGFTFVGSEYKLSNDNKNYYEDL